MEYRLVRNDELYHYGVPGMRWGHRKAVPDSYTSSKARYKAAKRAFNRSHSRAYNYSAFHLMSQFTNPKKKAKADRLWEQAKKDGKNFNAAQKEYKREKARTADQRAAIRKERVKTAAKVGAAVGATALAAYGGYKIYKLQGEAATSLGKKYTQMGDMHMHMSRNRLASSTKLGIDARRLEGAASEAKRSSDRKVYSESAKNLRAIAEERYGASQKSMDTARQYYQKAANNDYSRKEVAREMIDIAKRRKRNNG